MTPYGPSNDFKPSGSRFSHSPESDAVERRRQGTSRNERGHRGAQSYDESYSDRMTSDRGHRDNHRGSSSYTSPGSSYSGSPIHRGYTERGHSRGVNRGGRSHDGRNRRENRWSSGNDSQTGSYRSNNSTSNSISQEHTTSQSSRLLDSGVQRVARNSLNNRYESPSHSLSSKRPSRWAQEEEVPKNQSVSRISGNNSRTQDRRNQSLRGNEAFGDNRDNERSNGSQGKGASSQSQSIDSNESCHMSVRQNGGEQTGENPSYIWPPPASTPGPSSRSINTAPPRSSTGSPEPDIRISSNIFETGSTTAESQPSESDSTGEMKVIKSDPTDINEDQVNLRNIFRFSAPLPQVAPTESRVLFEPAPAKIPRTARYNQHTKEEEVQYVDKYMAQRAQGIPASNEGCEDSESEDESAFANPTHLRQKKFGLRDNVFKKYDFTKRIVDNRKLAIWQQREHIIKEIEEHRVVILDGFTGCGKTTQIPQFLIDRAYETERPCNVIVTQPRRIAAVSVARRVCEERAWEIGTVVGYHVGMDKKVSSDTLVTYVTTGLLLQQLTKCRSLQKWTHIIVDEVHERDMDTDLLLLFMRKILQDDTSGKERNVKIILMSATLNVDQFSQYFRVQRSEGTYSDTPIIKIPTVQRFQVDEIYLDQLVKSTNDLDELSANLEQDRPSIASQVYEIAVKTIANLDDLERDQEINTENRGSVLVFLPGIYEIKTMNRLLSEEAFRFQKTSNFRADYAWDIVPLHSSITNEEQRKVFVKPEPGRRKIILSTNIAESSITVPDIVYVVDFCLTKSNCVDVGTNFRCLKICWASANQCIQRKGRTGRVQAGTVYRMVPKSFFVKLDQDAPPEMRRSSLEYVVLQVKIFEMGTPEELLSLALDPPELSGIERAVANLKEVGALTVRRTERERSIYETCDGDLTFLGEIMAALPVDQRFSRLIMLGYCFGVLKETIIIAAALNGKTPFISPYNPKEQLDAYSRKFKFANNSYSDCMSVLYAYRMWVKQFGDDSKYSNYQQKAYAELNWGRTYWVKINVLREIQAMVEDIEERLKQKRIVSDFSPIPYDNDSDDIPKEVALMIKVAIAGAFYPQYFQRQKPDNDYAQECSRAVCGRDLFSTVYYKGFPPGNKGIVYKKRIQDALANGTSIPHVEFSAQKVLATFDGPGTKIGPIPEGVYRAVKKRLLREKLEFHTIWREDEEDLIQEHRRKLEQLKYIKCPDQVGLPGVGKNKITVHVTYIDTPSRFWVICDKHYDTQNEIDTAIAKSKLRRRAPQCLRIGGLYLAPHVEGKVAIYFRARLDYLYSHGECLVYFVDYGNSELVKTDLIREFTEELINKHYHKTKCLAVECTLSETRPAVMHGSVWSQRAIDEFISFHDYQKLEMEIYSVYNSIICGELFRMPKEGETERVSFNKWLKKDENKFADYAKEPFRSIRNHETRERFDLIKDKPEVIMACNAEQVAQPVDRTVMEPPEVGKSMASLKGPWSPLELQFQSLCKSSTSKAVTVDGNSVNCVVLDFEPMAGNYRMLVGAVVNIQDKNGNVVARDTSLMPAIPGMMALMSLVFAPKAELRCDQSRTRYTGVLCGLGIDDDGEPVYDDHDLEIVFDTEIDDEDIKQINHIRHDMNVLLRHNRPNNATSIHRHLCERMFRLLNRNRKPIKEEIWPAEAHMWDRLPEQAVKPPPPHQFPVYPSDIFRPHATVQLEPEQPSSIVWNFAV